MRVQFDVGHPQLVPPGGGEILSATDGRWTEILCDTEELVVSLFRRGAGVEGPDLHVHRAHADGFYVLEGTLVVPLGPDAEPEHVPVGSLALAPPLVVHAFRMDAGDVELLNIHAPGAGFAAYMRGANPDFDQEEPPPDGGRPRADAVAGTGEVLGDRPGLRVALLADEAELGICEVTSSPGGVAPPAHVHERHAESLYVLAGELLLTAAGHEYEAAPGTWVHLPAGVPHTFAVAGETEARFLDLHTPSCGFGDFARALNAARSEADLAAARAAFDQLPA
jgi:quercetin dioxygenase-like cupin family protein